MNAFFTLNRDEQLARLETLARDVLLRFFTGDYTLKLHSYTNNAIFRVNRAGSVYALRVHRPGLKKHQWIESEVAFLRMLKTTTDLKVPNPLREPAAAALEGFDEPVYAVLFDWLDGDTCLPDALTLHQVYLIGQYAAALHNVDIPGDLPEPILRPTLDWEGLFGKNSPYDPGEGAALFTPDQVKVMDEVAELVRRVMEKQGQDGVGLIHADLRPQNMLWSAGDELAVLDFDDCAYGYSLYDLAVPLLFFKSDPRYDEMRTALIDGYHSVRPIQDQQDLETLVAGRYVASCRWVAGHPGMRDRAPEIITGRIADLKRFLNTGRL